MKSISTIMLLLILSFLSYGQCRDFPNRIDSIGLKQGCWRTLNGETDYLTSGSKVKGEGTFRDNKKTGNWTYFFENPLTCGFYTKVITYNSDGSVFEDNTWQGYDMAINADTSVITVNTQRRSDTLTMECKNGECQVIINNKRKLLLFHFDEFDYFQFQVMRFVAGDFDAEINRYESIR